MKQIMSISLNISIENTELEILVPMRHMYVQLRAANTPLMKNQIVERVDT